MTTFVYEIARLPNGFDTKAYPPLGPSVEDGIEINRSLHTIADLMFCTDTEAEREKAEEFAVRTWDLTRGGFIGEDEDFIGGARRMVGDAIDAIFRPDGRIGDGVDLGCHAGVMCVVTGGEVERALSLCAFDHLHLLMELGMLARL